MMLARRRSRIHGTGEDPHTEMADGELLSLDFSCVRMGLNMLRYDEDPRKLLAVLVRNT
jgi:hypothetical protein